MGKTINQIQSHGQKIIDFDCETSTDFKIVLIKLQEIAQQPTFVLLGKK